MKKNNDNSVKLTPSVVFRGKPGGRITAEDYEEAIQQLQEAKSQLQPDGDNCHVCHDSGHQAWECHHNPLAMARKAALMEHQWRCFHCGDVFTDAKSAAEHFGSRYDETPAACQNSGTITAIGSLPDGSSFASVSTPLPKSHWIYNTDGSADAGEPPMPFRMGIGSVKTVGNRILTRRDFADAIRKAGQYAVRASTMCGKDENFDPDAMVQNLIVGMLGYWTTDGTSDSEGQVTETPQA